MPKDYVVSNINEDLQERIQNITQQILSRTHLLQIIDKSHLYNGGHRRLAPDEKVALMRKNVGSELVRDSQPQNCSLQDRIFSAGSPCCPTVTGELTNLFISENLEVRQQQSEDTTKFLEAQLETARQSLDDAGRKDPGIQRGTRK